MTDVLDLSQGDRPPSPARRLPKPVGLLIVGVVLLSLLGGIGVGARALYLNFVSAPDYPGPGSGRTVVRIHPDDSAAAIGGTLLAQGVVKSVKAFRDAARADSRSRTLAPGYYAVRQHMSARAALALLLDPRSRLRSHVVIPEGSSLSRELALIAKGSEVGLGALQQAAQQPAALGLPDYANGRLEGFLFPASYDIDPGTSATEVLTTMVRRFAEAAAAADLTGRAAAAGHTPYQVLIVASLVERETGAADDRARVAAVIWNRLRAGMPLQLDSTVNYALGLSTIRVTTAQTRVDSPYNTYRIHGLPPTPIAAPGQAAIEAALSPAPGGALYFVRTSKDGHSFFTSSYSAFLAAKAKAQRDGVY
ncbi:MAG: endolytic transglycosylase MltG [Actinomycetota bacterium]|nr:endolytic transglycosylase MltG [Actinomycetota bacterium]